MSQANSYSRLPIPISGLTLWAPGLLSSAICCCVMRTSKLRPHQPLQLCQPDPWPYQSFAEFCCLPSLGLSALRGFKHAALQTQLVEQCSVIAVGVWGLGTRSLQETGAQMTGEGLVVWESSWAGARGVLGSGGDLRFWGAHVWLCTSRRD